MELKNALDIFSTLVSIGAFGFVGALSKKAFYVWQKNKAYDFQKVMENFNTIHNSLECIVDKTSAFRAVLLRIENGGSRPAVGKTLYSSAIQESVKEGIEKLSSNWQRQLVDDEYIRKITEVFDKKQARFSVSTMQPGILRDTYIARGITESLVFSIYATKTQFFYLSINLGSNEVRITDADVIRSEVNRIRNIFHEQYRWG